jgi:hypothetical protein
MTESEKLQAKLKDAEIQLAQAKRERLIARVARAANLPDELAELLQGDTEEALAAHAEKLKKFAQPAQPEKNQLKINPTNPGQAHLEETRAQKKARLTGSAPDIWAGGGVNWEETPKG